MPFTKADFSRWAQAALSEYALAKPQLTFLGHSDNLTFRVDETGGASYLLRLHYPVSTYYQGMRQLPEAIASELVWMEALCQEAGITVQRPVHARSGLPAVQVEVEPGIVVPVTLLTWLEGSHFSPALPDASERIRQLGDLVAQMHDFSSRWAAPAQMARPVYDRDHFRRIFARLLRGVDLGIFSEDVFRILRSTAREILDEIDRLGDQPAEWGMIHADLHVGNFLLNDQQIVPIDFSFCGFGHYLFDVSVCLAGGLNASLRPAFLEGYRSRRSLSEDDLRTVEAYALTGRVSYYAYQIDLPAERKWLQSRVPSVAENECARFLRGERILEIM